MCTQELPALLWCERLEHILDRQKAKMDLGQDQLRPLQSSWNRCPEHLQRGWAHLKLPTLLLSFPVWPPRLAMAEAHSLKQVDDIKVKNLFSAAKNQDGKCFLTQALVLEDEICAGPKVVESAYFLRGFSAHFMSSAFAICQLIGWDQNFKLGTAAASNWIRISCFDFLSQEPLHSTFSGFSKGEKYFQDMWWFCQEWLKQKMPPALYLASNPHPGAVGSCPGRKERWSVLR